MTAVPGALPAPLAAWHDIAARRDPAGLADLVAEDCVFRSPAVHRPQEGKALTIAYLSAAIAVLGPTLAYHRQWYDDTGAGGAGSAVLEFTASLATSDGRTLDVHGIDMLAWSDRAGRQQLTEFSVMVRPLRALERLIELMRAQLAPA